MPNKSTVQKKFYVPEEIAQLIKELAKELNMTESDFITELVRNYAIDCNKMKGVKNNHILELIPSNDMPKNDILPDDITHIQTELRIIKHILNGIDEYGYITRDALNMLMTYLNPPFDFKSTDIELNLSNRENYHRFLKESKENYLRRLERRQIRKAGL